MAKSTVTTRKTIRGKLRVELPSGHVIHEPVSADTFVAAIDEAVKATSPTKVKTVPVNAKGTSNNWCGFPLVSDSMSVYTVPKYAKSIKQCPKCGLYVDTCSNNRDKKILLDRISDRLGLHWKVTV